MGKAGKDFGNTFMIGAGALGWVADECGNILEAEHLLYCLLELNDGKEFLNI